MEMGVDIGLVLETDLVRWRDTSIDRRIRVAYINLDAVENTMTQDFLPHHSFLRLSGGLSFWTPSCLPQVLDANWPLN